MIVRFGDVVKEVKDNIDRSNNPYERYVAGDHMDSDDLHIHRWGHFSTDDVGPAFTRVFKTGQVLYGSRRTYLKKIAVAEFDGITANTTFVLETKDENVLRQKLIPFIMRSIPFTKWSISHSKGSTNPYVLFKDLATFEFDLPSIEKQDELAEILCQSDNVEQNYRKLMSETDKVVQSEFIEMFGDPDENPNKYPVLSFSEFASIDANMTTDYDKYADYPHIGIDNIEKNTGLIKNYRTVKEDGVKSAEYIFTKKHIIYSKIRPNLNKVALPDFDGLCSADAYPILPNPENCNRVYLAYVMRSAWFLRYIVPLSARTNMPKANRKQIQGFKWPLAPLNEQYFFSSFVSQAENSKAELNKMIRDIKLVQEAIIKENWGGE